VLSECEDLADVSVYGVSIPRHEGRAGCAAVILKPNASGELRRLAEFAMTRLPKYAVPLFLREVKVMLKTENNKLMKGPFKREGVNPDLVSQTDTLYWLQKDSESGARYVPFTRQDWQDLEQGIKSL
jgi:acyl-CoA synthetase (AMP-forming)/AMP-acid ligase II